MTLSLIVAMDEKGLIGTNNKLPWYLPEDLKRFKEITTGHPIIMGRKTFESIGRALPERENIVITKNKKYTPKNVSVFHEWKTAVSHVKNNSPADEEAFVIGGAQLFKVAIRDISKIYLTQIHETFKGDVYLRELAELGNLDGRDWKAIHTEEFPKNDTTPYAYRFSILVRNKSNN